MTGLAKSLSFLYCPLSIRTQQYSRISLDGGGGPGPIPASGVDLEDVLPSVLLGRQVLFRRTSLWLLWYVLLILSFYFPKIYLHPDLVAPNAPSTLSTIKWGSDVVSKLKRLIHSAKPSGAVTKMSCRSVCPLYFKVENPLTRQLGGKSMVCSMVNKVMFVGAVVSAIDLPSNGALFSTAVLNVAEAPTERLKLNKVLRISTSPAT